MTVRDRLRAFELATRPVPDDLRAALERRWAELPAHARTPAQVLGQHSSGCEGTHGVSRAATSRARRATTVHADRGSSMTSKPVAFLLANLGVLKTHNRPYTSTDNPYSEAQFKTLKYRPDFPARFASIEHARAFCRQFFAWYNGAHRHSSVGLMTPVDVHHGRAETVHADRTRVLDAAYAATPERFVRHPPRPPALPTAAWINKPTDGRAAAH